MTHFKIVPSGGVFFEHFGKNSIYPKFKKLDFFQKLHLKFAKKLDFSRNLFKFGGHFWPKQPDFQIKSRNSFGKRKKLDFKRQKLVLKAQKLSKTPKTRSENQKTRFQKPKNSIYRHFERVDEGEIVLKKPCISFHLSHQPPLKVTEHFLCSKSDSLGRKVHCNFQRRLMTQMKAYPIPMKNWTHICLNIVFCRHEQVQPDVPHVKEGPPSKLLGALCC